MFNKFSVAIAVFGADQRLLSCNSRYSRLWNISQDWLNMRPTQGDILDRLRESRSLPEQRDFAAWKKATLERFEDNSITREEFWHLPNGRSLRVASYPHLQGGMFFTFEDVSETLALKASNAALAAVQRATLDSMEDAIAIFEPDGRLTLSNRAFAKLWCLTDEELVNAPHFTRLASLCEARNGYDRTWDFIATAIGSQDPETHKEWNGITRADDKVLSLAPSRLPNGSTMITFRDTTDVERFDAWLSEEAHTAA
jgi:PAS domain-containing protein